MISNNLIYKIRISVFLILLTIAGGIFSQTVSKQLSNINGLSNNSINCIFEDSEHTLWVGTWDGLNAYNGRDFKTYRYNKNNISSISNNIIRQIIEQDSISIWVATDYGINKWNKGKENFTCYFYGSEYNPPKQESSFLLGKTSQNKIICYIRELGFYYYEPKLDKFEALQIPDLKEDIKKFIIDNNDNIFTLTHSGKVSQSKIEHSENTIKIRTSQLYEGQSIVSNIFISKDKLILNYAGYLRVIDESNSFPTSIDIDKDKNISEVIYHNQSLYISYYEGGCYSYKLGSRKLEKITGIISDKTSIFSIYISDQDILWIGTDGQGLYQIYEHSSPFKTIKTNHAVRSFCETKGGDILIGTKGDGIKILKKDSASITGYLNIFNGLTSNSVYAIKKNKSGDIFIGSEGEGIAILRANTDKIEKLNGTNKIYFKAVYSICFTNNGSILWLGTSGYGLIKIKLKKENDNYFAESVEQYTSSNLSNSLNNNIIYSIMPDRDNEHLWIGTRGGGVNKFNIAKKIFKRIDDIYNISLTNNDVLSIQTDENQNLWIGTSYGLNRVVLSGSSATIQEFTEDEGLPNNTIHGILKDENEKIWISTNSGISSIDTQSGKIESYTVNDGLQNNEFADGSYFEDGLNTLYFGGVSGFSYFKPTEIHLRNFEPTLGLSSLRIYNTSQNIHERIQNNTLKLSNDESHVTFTFIAHDFINNENCEYDYRLINFSDEWIHNGNNPNIVFTKLPPGKYQLEVKCTNGDKLWSNNIYTIHLDVAHPWWLSTLAFVIYFILATIIIYIIQSVVRNRINLSRQVLLEHIEKQHQQKIHESRLNFFTNVAHEFFTPLTLIYGPAQYLLEKSSLDNTTKHYIQIIKNNADRMQKLISELMEFRKLESGHTPLHPESIDIKMMIDYISDNYTEIAQENKIEFEITTENISSITSDRNSLEKILFNIISNAFKYTPIGGNIRINIEQNTDDKNLNITIRNSGKGLTSKQMSQIFSKFKIFDSSKMQNSTSTGIGLNLTKSLVELLGGNIQVTSQLGEYVEFNIEIPDMPSEDSNTTGTEETAAAQTTINEVTISERKDIHILIVEDERNIRELLRDILSPHYNVSDAVNGEEALTKIEQNIPDIIISDIMMPQLDGITLISKLKSSQRTKHIPIISISAKSSVEDHINAYEHGADLYITKPFHPRHVLTAVENLIGKNLILKEYFNSSRSSIIVKDGLELHSEDEQFINEIVTFIENNLEDESLNPNSISDFLGISKATLYRRLKDLTDRTPSEYVRTIRLKHASRLLITTKLTISEIMFRSGFANKSYFYREFAKQFGASPKDYRNSKIN